MTRRYNPQPSRQYKPVAGNLMRIACACLKLAEHLLINAALLISVASGVTKAPPDLSGSWKLNRSKSTAGARSLKDDSLVVHEKGDQVTFDFLANGEPDGSESFHADGVERSRYTTRIERAYSRARWEKNALTISTRHVLDALGYQTYTDMDRWVISGDRKTLTNELSDGTMIVYEWEGPAPRDPFEGVQEFHAIGVSHVTNGDAVSSCQFDISGKLRGKPLGTGNYHMCLVRGEQQVPQSAAPPGSTSCAAATGILSFTTKDNSAFDLTVTGQFCSHNQSFLGTYEVDGKSVTGQFASHLTGGSGLVQFSNNTKILVLTGVLLYE